MTKHGAALNALLIGAAQEGESAHHDLFNSEAILSMARALFRNALIAASLAAIATPAPAQIFSDGYEFLKAVRDRDGQKVTDTLNEPGATIVNTRDKATGETALHIVTSRRETVWVRFLLQKGANPNIADRDGTTPLMIATGLGEVEAAEILIKRGAKVDVSNATGETPLIAAIHRRDLPMIKMLLEHGANPDKSDNSGRNARDYAGLMNSNEQLIDALETADTAREAAVRAPQTYGPDL